MIILKMSGGLGNQMFQYALYKQLEYMGRNILMNDYTYYESEGTRTRQIDIFNLEYQCATREEINKLTDSSLFIKDRIRRKIFGRKSKVYKEKHVHFDPMVFELTDAYLEGYWQSERFFPNVKEHLLESFRFPEPNTVKNKKYLQEIKLKNSVGVHIRRGDYLLKKYSGLYEGICTQEYYEKAFQQMRIWYPDCHFFLFSNDAEWAIEHYRENNYTIICGNDENNGYYD
ncbi:MAG: alpha-1,2-fucosyltransferase, partial [Lachnospiraceae bacterium]|nr:alpha-1,2-fucosyltransferase [Lachnospiraceae bacterium]